MLFNDICPERRSPHERAGARVVDLEVYGDKVMIANFSADGVICEYAHRLYSLFHVGGRPHRGAYGGEYDCDAICPHALSAGPSSWDGSVRCPLKWGSSHARLPICR